MDEDLKISAKALAKFFLFSAALVAVPLSTVGFTLAGHLDSMSYLPPRTLSCIHKPESRSFEALCRIQLICFGDSNN